MIRTLLALCLLSVPAAAQEHQHPGVTYSGDVARFYETWTRPDSPRQSCCNKVDCAPIRGVRKTLDGRVEAQRDIDGAWLIIPPAKMEQGRDSPDGRSHMCSMGFTVFCFIFGTRG